LLEGKLPMKKVIQSWADFTPVPSTPFSPIGDALALYLTDTDIWSDKKIWGERMNPNLPQDEIYSGTHPFFTHVGEMSDKIMNIDTPEGEPKRGGVSPARLEGAAKKVFTYGNVWTDAVGFSYNALFDLLTNEEREKISNDILRDIPVGRSFIRTTNPNVAFEDKFERIAQTEGSVKLKQNQEVDRLFRAGDKKGFKEFVYSLPQEDRMRVKRRWDGRNEKKDLPNVVFELDQVRDTGTRVKDYYEVWSGMNEEDRKELKSYGRKLGWFTEMFTIKFNRLEKETKKTENTGEKE